jgi:hypothetical protein
MNIWRPSLLYRLSTLRAYIFSFSKSAILFTGLLGLGAEVGCTRHLGRPPAANASSVRSYAQHLRHLEQGDSLRNFSAGLREEQANWRLVALRQEALAHYDSIHFSHRPAIFTGGAASSTPARSIACSGPCPRAACTTPWRRRQFLVDGAARCARAQLLRVLAARPGAVPKGPAAFLLSGRGATGLCGSAAIATPGTELWQTAARLVDI